MKGSVDAVKVRCARISNPRNVLFAFSGFVITTLVLGCGPHVSHQFLQERPLEKGNWEISFTWNYDFNQFSMPILIPDVNAYLGLSNSYNFGFGTQAIFVPTHLSIAKYYDQSENEFLTGYFHFNLGTVNPLFEAGGMYSSYDSLSSGSVSLGISYGPSWPWSLPLTMEQLKNLHDYDWKVIPVMKMAMTSQSYGMSLIHHHGLSSGFRENLRDRIALENDTIIILNSSQIVAINKHGIIMEDGDTLMLSNFPFLSKILPKYIDSFVPAERDKYDWWLGPQYEIYHVLKGDNLAVLDINDLIRQWKNSDLVVITRFTPSLAQRVSKTRSLRFDNSLGVAIFDRNL